MINVILVARDPGIGHETRVSVRGTAVLARDVGIGARHGYRDVTKVSVRDASAAVNCGCANYL